ncbi:ribonuclease D [Angustibacter luteus]|uniref:Ribonuclease D n=1 Tax=Angustibacter luteus TaxID=658456 RepID=A0ABW1J932_9ACTN
MTEAAPTPLVEPRDGIPDVVITERRLVEAADALAAGTGPVAVDAERASGYRYGQAAYLVQLRREGAGSWLIDPAAVPDLSPVDEALRGVEWVLHAASQDLACLADVGMRPTRLFDTELGARLAGLAKVGLGSVVEELLGLTLAKEHSAVDWSTRPLPQDWLRYAALDVEVLVDLRDEIARLLEEQGKLEWAEQEFAALVAAPPAPARVDPWRRTSGTHKLRTRRQLAMLRELWNSRDALARQRDVSPGRVLPDAAMISAVTGNPRTLDELVVLPGFTGPAARRHGKRWLEALARGRHVAEDELPLQSLPSDAPPPPRAWPDRDADAAARLTFARAAIAELSERLAIPVENLMTPDTVRRVLWDPPSPDDLEDRLAVLRARPWQVELLAPILRDALGQLAKAPVTEEPEASDA